MGTSTNWLNTMARVEAGRLADSILAARKVLTVERDIGRTVRDIEARLAAVRAGATLPRPGSGALASLQSAVIRESLRLPQIKAELPKIPASFTPLPRMDLPDRKALDRLMHGRIAGLECAASWRTRLVEQQLDTARVATTYTKIRRALWAWPEFAGLRPGARTILEVVIELARDEAFPWYVPVQAMEVRRLARLTEGSFARSVRELLTLAVTRPGRDVIVSNASAAPLWPWRLDESQPPRPVAQWVVRYRRGIPWHAKRAAWWINYDLLCATGRALPAFAVSVRSLSKTYQSRNRAMGPRPCTHSDREAVTLADMRRAISLNGPFQPLGLRAPLWEDATKS